MLALTLIIHIFLGSTLAGSAIVLALVMGFDTALPIVTAGVVGFLVGFPVSWIVAKRLSAKAS